MEFHHLDPSEKDFALGNVLASPRSWATLVAELKKCVLVCSNCHKEIHAGAAEVPPNAERFDSQWEDYRLVEQSGRITECPIFGGPKRPEHKTCSTKCSCKLRRRIDWSKHDLIGMKKVMSYSQMSDIIGATVPAIHKKIKQMAPKGGIEPPTTHLTGERSSAELLRNIHSI